MQAYYVRILLCSAGSILIGLVAALAGSAIETAIIIAIVTNILALFITNADKQEQDLKRLAEQLILTSAVRESSYRANIERLISGLDKVQRQGYPAFEKWARESLTNWSGAVLELANGHLRVTDSQEIQERGRWLLQHLKSELFATSIVTMEQFWVENKGPEYQRENLDLARREALRITRVFVFSSRADLYSVRFEDIHRILRQQAAAGVTVLYTTLQDLPDKARVDFGIWDNEMVCYLTANPSDPTKVLEANYYTDEASMQKATQVKRAIESVAVSIETVMSEEELTLSAMLMKRDAPDYCTTETHVSRESCSWYHSSWQFLRLLNLVETPRLHNDFFVTYVRKLAGAPKPLSVLISGLADYEMLRVVLEALEDSGGQRRREPHLVRVLDACNTPIRVTQWYIERNKPSNTRIVAAPGFAQDTKLPEGSYDLVITDAFLSKMNYADQDAVISEWNRILKPGGEVLTTIKLNTDSLVFAVRATPEEAEKYAEKAASKVRSRADLDPTLTRYPITPEEMRKLAREYALKNVSYPLMAQGLPTRFPGFDVEVVATRQVEEYSISSYAQLIATKKPS